MELAASQYDGFLKSQFAISKRRGWRKLPNAFTEHGALTAPNVLNSPEAVKMSVYVVRAFMKQRHLILTQAGSPGRCAAMTLGFTRRSG
jgi:hypothetical protein